MRTLRVPSASSPAISVRGLRGITFTRSVTCSRDSALDHGFDHAVRLCGGAENLVAILESQWSEVHRQVMQVGHLQTNTGNVFELAERGVSHRVQRVLHGFAVVRRECFF